MHDIKDFLPKKSRMPRKENTRWLLYGIQKGIINPVPATGQVLRSDGSEYTYFRNWCNYLYIRIRMHSTDFSFFVHKCIYLKENGKIPPGKEIDHIDGDNSNNKGSNLRAVTMRQNLRKRNYRKETQEAF